MKIAIDVVLLLSAEMTAKVIEINRELIKNNTNKIVLNAHDCLPHISLCMGVIDDTNLLQVRAKLGSISTNLSPLQLSAENIRADVITTGEKVSGLRIKGEPSLQKLQVAVMDALWPYLTYDVDANMLHNPQEVEEVTFTWIKGYAKKYEDPSLFHPHITAGVGETNTFNDEFPMSFDASTLALCQLGNYCTARKILGAFKLAA